MKAAIPPLIYRSEDAGRPVGICTDAIKTFLLVPLPKRSPPLESRGQRRLNRVSMPLFRPRWFSPLLFGWVKHQWPHSSEFSFPFIRQAKKGLGRLPFGRLVWMNPTIGIICNDMQRMCKHMLYISYHSETCFQAQIDKRNSENWLKLLKKHCFNLLLKWTTRRWHLLSDASWCLKAQLAGKSPALSVWI